MEIGMKKKFVILMSLIILSVSGFVFAVPKYAFADMQTKQYVTDDAGLFTKEEEEELTKLCKKASDGCKTDVAIITQEKGLDGKELESYVRKLIEQNYGYNGNGEEPDAIVYVIDMTTRADMIITSGNARTQKSFTQSRLASIREKAEKKLAAGEYYAGCKKYILGVRKQMDNTMSYRLTLYLPLKVLISFIAAAVAVLAMLYQSKSKMTVDGTTYTKNHNFNVRRREDRFINTTVVTRHIETSSGSSSGGGGGGNSGSSGGHF